MDLLRTPGTPRRLPVAVFIIIGPDPVRSRDSGSTESLPLESEPHPPPPPPPARRTRPPADLECGSTVSPKALRSGLKAGGQRSPPPPVRRTEPGA